MNYNNKTITITFGDQAENHKGMQQIGALSKSGFTYEDLVKFKDRLETENCECKLVNLNDYVETKMEVETAGVLVIKNGVNKLLENIGRNVNELFEEQNNLDVDKKALMYGRVVNKHARYNLCFSDFTQEPDYKNGLGRVIAFNDVPLTNHIRQQLNEYFGKKALNLQAEGNYYYDINKCGIGWHSDLERRKVIAIRLGEAMPLYFNWFHKSKPIGNKIQINLEHGDMYIMSEKAVGTDGCKRSIPVLRHATGCDKYTKL
jgi:hypothetical protein